MKRRAQVGSGARAENRVGTERTEGVNKQSEVDWGGKCEGVGYETRTAGSGRKKRAWGAVGAEINAEWGTEQLDSQTVVGRSWWDDKRWWVVVSKLGGGSFGSNKGSGERGICGERILSLLVRGLNS